ncbi:hypothetical protein SUGI_1192080 [Cryptomeria japonica]|uniref:uncharacterized protein LOC131063099 n=1 Tax=Cryptomeria japonica TaxID=3369 RepID=UPI002414756A|nr:uncharacterized protein LOC131063099 [Cryptomeria japonica]GLJ55516.1 hypothetical protein SUGI_1192080 [Cryptomeria japonica]
MNREHRMVKEYKCKLCREVFTTLSDIAGHKKCHKSDNYSDEVETAYNLLVEQTPSPFSIAGPRNEWQARGGSGYAVSNLQPPFAFLYNAHGEKPGHSTTFTGLASPLSQQGNLYLGLSRGNLNRFSCSAPGKSKGIKLRIPQDYPIIYGADTLRFQPQDPRGQGSDLDSGLSLDVHHRGKLNQIVTYRAPGKGKEIILEAPQNYPVVSSADTLRFLPQQQIRQVQNYEDLFRNDSQKFQQEEDNGLIYFPPDSIQNDIREVSLQFQQQRDHNSSSSHSLQNLLRGGAQRFQQLHLNSPSSQNVLRDNSQQFQQHRSQYLPNLRDDFKQFKQQDHNFLHSSYDSLLSADHFLQDASPGNLEDVLGVSSQQFEQQCDDIFPYLTGGLNSIFENGSPESEQQRDQYLPHNVNRGNSKQFQQPGHNNPSPPSVNS